MGQKLRSETPEQFTWDLTPLYASEQSWKNDYATFEKSYASFSDHRGKLSTNATTLCKATEHYLELSRWLEKLYTWAHLRSDEDTSNAQALGNLDQVTNLYARFSEIASYFTPELLAIPDESLATLLQDTSLAPYRRMIQEIVRYKPHTLSENEESILARASEVLGSSQKIFSQLNNADFSFGEIVVDGDTVPLTHGTYSVLLKHADRNIRHNVFRQYYQVFNEHRHTLAATLTSSIKKDEFVTRTRKFCSTRERGLFGDNVDTTVYDNLISTVEANLSALHHYYKLRKQQLCLSTLAVYDTYIPIVPDVKLRHSFEEASTLILEALQPLGDEYVSVLRRGLLENRWVDVFESKGKRSGAYSSGCYDSPPYMLLNYKDDNLHDVYTLAHEAGHSMHSYFSCKHQPYQDHSYTIFVAEVASTFNEILLTHHLLKKYQGNAAVEAYLTNQQIDDMKATLYRQTMFAEFEREAHQTAAKNTALTVDWYRTYYHTLLTKYFGPSVEISDLDTLECFRIPHFYSSFYVYKYATGISAAFSLAQQVLSGDVQATENYLNFLKGGGSRYPLELLAGAGVDMTTPAPVASALSHFGRLVEYLEKVLPHAAA